MVKYCWSLRLWLFFHILFWHWNKHFSFTKQSAFSYCDLLKQDMERPTWDKLLCIYLIENAASTGNGLNLSHSFPQFLFIFKLQGLRWKKKKKSSKTTKWIWEKKSNPCSIEKVTVTVTEKVQRLEWQPVRDDEMRLWGLFSHPHMSAHCAQMFMTHGRRKPTGSITLSHDYGNSRRWLPSQALHLAHVGMFAAIVQIILVRKKGPSPPTPTLPRAVFTGVHLRITCSVFFARKQSTVSWHY